VFRNILTAKVLDLLTLGVITDASGPTLILPFAPVLAPALA